jgi:uncharacterized SAM-binding protein YcdF (DUF218 family)
MIEDGTAAAARLAASGAADALRLALIWGGRVAAGGLVLLALTYLAVWLMQGWQQRTHHVARPVVPPVDAVIVLGGGMDPDGTLNTIGRARADAAMRLLARGDAAHAIFTGTGFAGDAAPSEAAAMRARALARGAERERLIVEPDARTTLENLTLSFAIADRKGFGRLAVLTDAFHLTRALALARLLGRDVVPVAVDRGAGALPAAEQVPVLLRETLAWWYNLGKAAAWAGLGLLGWTEAARAKAIR